MLLAGQEFAGFTVVELLGAGGMGEVYLVEHPRLPRRDALKVLPASVSADNEFRQRFIREADLAATLFHPNIVGMHDRGECDGQLWMSMDYIAGVDAAKLVHERYPAGMPLDEAVAIAIAVADALDHAHESGLLHRDVKPANILLAQPHSAGERRIFLADFGIARPLADPNGLTATNLTLGTVSYAAPEQLAGEELDARADQYALAATVFHLLAGAPPFDKSNPVAVISAHLSAPPPLISHLRPELSRLDEVFATAMAKDPAQRFGSCREFAAALSNKAGVEPQFGGAKTQNAMLATSRDSPSKGWRKHLGSKNRVIAAAAAATVLAGLGAVGYTMKQDSSDTTSETARPGGATVNQAQAAGTAATAQSAAEALKSAIPEITKIIEVNEENDPNEGSLGRPNSYVAASVLYDSRLTCPDLGMECGATIEQFPDQEAAQRRSDYLQAIRQGGILGREWNTVKGPLLLRVAGDMTPAEAKQYETAFLTGSTGSAPAAGAQIGSNAETPAVESVASGFGQNGKSVVGIVIATTEKPGSVGQFVTSSINFLDQAGSIIKTAEHVESFNWTGQQLVLPTSLYLDDPETRVASIETSVSISEYSSSRTTARPELPVLDAESITETAPGQWTPAFTFTNSTAEDLADLRVGVVCYDAAETIIGEGSTFPKLIATGKSVLIDPAVTTSGQPANCKASLNY